MGRYTDSAGAPADDVAHPWACALDRFPNDTLLRLAGFEVAARPRGKEAVWRRAGKVYGQAQALVMALGGRHR